MKTLAVLAALAAVAMAVPAPPGYDYERYRPVQYRLPAQFRREKKSPQELTIENAPALDAAAFELARPELEVIPEVSARTIGLKKPIIVKKKFGYHLYRDSDEEQAQADPADKCTKEVKVKLCDAESLAHSTGMRSADEDSSAQLSENDMKHSIKMAKDAVENLQKMTQFKNANLGPDAEMHEDIEVARQALEHIQKNFGNLETMNLQATTLSDAEALHHARINIANDSERMAQWKEAIDNIQKNAELAKNIEDSFKSADQTKISPQESELNKKFKSTELETIEKVKDGQITGKSNEEKKNELEEPLKKNAELEELELVKKNIEQVEPSMKTADHEDKKNIENDAPLKKSAESNELLKKDLEHEVSLNKNAVNKESLKKIDEHELSMKKIDEHDLSMKKNAEEESINKNVEELLALKHIEHEEPFKKNAEQGQLHEMETAASEHKEIKLPLDTMPLKGKEVEDMKVDHKDLEKETITDHNKQGKSTELDSSIHAPEVPVMGKSADNENTVKATTQEDKLKKLEQVAQPKESDIAEGAFDMAPAQSAPEMNLVFVPAEEKSAWKETNGMKVLEKSSEGVPVTKEKKIVTAPRMEHEKNIDSVVDTTSLMKDAEPKLHEDTLESQIHGKQAHEMVNSAENKDQDTNQRVVLRPIAPLRSANLIAEPHLPRMPAESSNVPHHLNENVKFQPEAKNWHADKITAKNDDTLHGDEFARTAQFRNQPSGQFSSFSGAHASSHAGSHGHFGPQYHNSQFHHGHHMSHGLHGLHGMHRLHGKTAEADSMVQATSQINSNDASGKEAARGAYGAYGGAAGAGAGALSLGGGGAGAVGVFPGANVGGCAIPLLLSCSPSVVPGSLAKSSYGGAHAYRAGEDFHDTRFHNKRDTKKNKEIASTKVKRTPKKAIEKISLDKKL